AALFRLVRRRRGFARIIRHIPAPALQLKAGARKDFLQLAATFGAAFERCIRHLLHHFEMGTALFAYIFINWHGVARPPINLSTNTIKFNTHAWRLQAMAFGPGKSAILRLSQMPEAADETDARALLPESFPIQGRRKTAYRCLLRKLKAR